MSDVHTSRKEQTARTHFHIALGGIFLVCLAPVVSWALALLHWKESTTTWRRRLFGLAVLDTLVVLALMVFQFRAVVGDPTLQWVEPRTGVTLNAAARPAVEIAHVQPESSAERAGLRIGDRVLSVNGERVDNTEQFKQRIGAAATGTGHHLRISRAGIELDVDVPPEESMRTTREPARGTSDARPGMSWQVSLQEMAPTLAEVAGLIVILAVSWVRRAASLVPVLAVMGVTLLQAALQWMTFPLFQALLGPSLGAFLSSHLVAGSAALGLGVILLRAMRGHWADVERLDAAPGVTTPSTVLGGIFYGLTGALRALAFLIAFSPSLAFAETPVPSLGLRLSSGPAVMALALVALVIVAPIGEEVLYRGILLPWLRTWASPLWAVVLCSLVFAVAHLDHGLGIVVIFVYAVVLSWARLRTGNLRASIALHMLVNATACVFSLVHG